jgi:hypothetical protein
MESWRLTVGLADPLNDIHKKYPLKKLLKVTRSSSLVRNQINSYTKSPFRLSDFISEFQTMISET